MRPRWKEPDFIDNWVGGEGEESQASLSIYTRLLFYDVSKKYNFIL